MTNTGALLETDSSSKPEISRSLQCYCDPYKRKQKISVSLPNEVDGVESWLDCSVALPVASSATEAFTLLSKSSEFGVFDVITGVVSSDSGLREIQISLSSVMSGSGSRQYKKDEYCCELPSSSC